MDDTIRAGALPGHGEHQPVTGGGAPAREVVLFVAAAYALTWIVWVPRALHDQGAIDLPGIGAVAAV